MANVLRALDTSNAWSSDDSDEETHFREMVQLSIQARRLEPKGTGDDAVSEDAANNRAARDTVLDSSDDDAVEDDDADARGQTSFSRRRRRFGRLAWEAESLRVLPTIRTPSREHALSDGGAREHVRGARDGARGA
jgi:hypothetical protein